jgi:hypothetical protein
MMKLFPSIFDIPCSIAENRLQRILASFACANAHGIFQIQYKYFSIPDFARVSALANSLDCIFALIVGGGYFNLAFGKKVDIVFRPAVSLDLAFLFPRASNVRYRQTGYADFGESFLDFL